MQIGKEIIRVKEFKAYDSVKFGKTEVNHFYEVTNNPVRQYLKGVEIYYVKDLNAMLVFGPHGKAVVNMSNVAHWIPWELDDIISQVKKVTDKKSKPVSKED